MCVISLGLFDLPHALLNGHLYRSFLTRFPTSTSVTTLASFFRFFRVTDHSARPAHCSAMHTGNLSLGAGTSHLPHALLRKWSRCLSWISSANDHPKLPIKFYWTGIYHYYWFQNCPRLIIYQTMGTFCGLYAHFTAQAVALVQPHALLIYTYHSV